MLCICRGLFNYFIIFFQLLNWKRNIFKNIYKYIVSSFYSQVEITCMTTSFHSEGRYGTKNYFHPTMFYWSACTNPWKSAVMYFCGFDIWIWNYSVDVLFMFFILLHIYLSYGLKKNWTDLDKYKTSNIQCFSKSWK